MSRFIRLAEIAKRVNKKNVDLEIDKVVTVTSSGKLVDPLSYFDYEVASKNKRNYKIVAENNFVYNPSRINIGSIAFNNTNEQVIVSPMYEVFEIDIDRILPEYLMLFFMSGDAKFQIENKTEKGARFRFTIDSMMSLMMTLPDLKTQHSVLNSEKTIKSYVNQLEAELEARTKQYEYYCNQLLDFSTGSVGFPHIDKMLQELCPDGVLYAALIDVAELIMGTSPSGESINRNANGIEFHQGKSHFGNKLIKDSKLWTSRPIKLAKAKSIIMSVRAPVGDCNITNRDIAIGRGLCSLRGKEDLNTDFLYYWIKSNIEYIISFASGSTFQAINTKEIKELIIPIPPLSIQEEIVRIMDKFSEYTSSITEGLPAEIELRRKQYEYYRNKLLTF